MGKVFKAKYFPNSYFLEAHLGSRPSATWRGIMKARFFFEKVIRTRIKNGHVVIFKLLRSDRSINSAV